VRKRPIIVEAHQWINNGDHPDDGEETFVSPSDGQTYLCEGKVVRYFRHPNVPGEKPCEVCGLAHHVHGWIDTLEAGHRVCPGDYIITGVKGERYPIKPDIFFETYEVIA